MKDELDKVDTPADHDSTRELSSVSPSTGASMQQLARLSEALLSMAAGDFGTRVDRTFTRDPFDVLAYLVNNTADELEGLISRVERQNEQLESILDAMADGIILIDSDGFIRRTNRSMLSMLGVRDEGALLNLPLASIIARGSIAAAKSIFQNASEVPERMDLEFDTNEGSERYPTTSTVIRSGAEVAGFVVLVQDDREFRRVRARAQLHDRMAAMGAMAAGVAHEINNPLAYVAANIDYVMALIDEGPVDPETATDALNDALDGVRRVREIVADLNTFSRADGESKAPVPLEHVILSAIKMLTSELKHRVDLETDIPELPLVEANEARLVQVFVNILMNSLHALDSKPRSERRLLVRASEVDDEVFVEIRDNGSGISKDDLPHIFDAFFTTKPVGKGTGLGLAISHQTVTNLGGRIDVHTSPTGTAFVAVFPVDRDLRRIPAEMVHVSEPSEVTESTSVLIVDDELPLAKALQRMLSASYQVTILTDPCEALELLQTRDFAAVLCDVMMPRLSGVELYHQIESARPELAERFIFMTGGAFTPSAQSFLEKAPVPCLRKPFDLAELKARIEALVSPE